MPKKLTQKEVLDRFKKVHGDEYDYSLVEYEGQSKKVIIVCRVHGHFLQRPGDHLRGSGCQDCGILKRSNAQRKTREKFIEDAKSVHGDKYDYSLVEYEGKEKKVIIICPIHGDFFQTPSNHIKYECRDCGILKNSNAQRKTREKFIEDAKSVHGDKYDYSLVEYVNAGTKVKIICKKDGHGVFNQIPSDHYRYGCPDCGILKRSNSRRSTKAQFIEDAKSVHGDKYDYSLVEYVNAGTKVKIICKKDGHGVFNQIPSNHHDGHGCRKCAIIQRAIRRAKTKEDFIKISKEIHPDKNFDYSKVEYVNNRTDVIISCPLHGDFKQQPNNHLQGYGCNDCGYIETRDKLIKSEEDFVEEANIKHSGIYKYDNVDYKGDRSKVSITCKKHGDFSQEPHGHLQGQGCPKCFNKNEGRLAIILNEIGIVHRNYRINNRYFDFYLPDYNLIIERDGEQHYYEPFKIVGSRMKTIVQNHQNDIEKTKLAKSKGHQIYRIPYWLSEEDEKKEIQNILNGQPTYPDVPDLEQSKTKPLPN